MVRSKPAQTKKILSVFFQIKINSTLNEWLIPVLLSTCAIRKGCLSSVRKYLRTTSNWEITLPWKAILRELCPFKLMLKTYRLPVFFKICYLCWCWVMNYFPSASWLKRDSKLVFRTYCLPSVKFCVLWLKKVFAIRITTLTPSIFEETVISI